MKKELFISEDLRTLQNKSSESLVMRTGNNPFFNPGKLQNIKTSEKVLFEKVSEKIVSEKTAEKVIAESAPTLPSGEQFRAILGIGTNTAETDNDERLF